MGFQKYIRLILTMCLHKVCRIMRQLIRKPSAWVIMGLLFYIIDIKLMSEVTVRLNSDLDVNTRILNQHDSCREMARNILSPEILRSLNNNAGCAPYPQNYMLKFSNANWQVLQISNWTVFLFSAHFDLRERSVSGDFVRILVLMGRGLIKYHELTCQMWNSEYSSPIISKVSEYHQIWPSNFGRNQDDTLLPYILSCPIPSEGSQRGTLQLPVAVSLVEEQCARATNKLKINYNILRKGEKKENFAVCVKGLDFPDSDISVRLIEWIELLRLMGVHKIYFYEFAVHRNTKRVLNYYMMKGAVDLAPFTLPGFYTNDPSLRHNFLIHNLRIKRRFELIPYNDCFYRLMYKYNYITLLDIDEVIIPQNSKTWHEMMETFQNKSHNRCKKIGHKKKCVFYGIGQTGCFVQNLKRDWFSEIPNYLNMLQHVYKLPFRRKSFSGVKGFADPNLIFSMLNHNPNACLRGVQNCSRYFADHDDAQLQHYRSYKKHCGERSLQSKITKCKELSCQEFVEDKTIWRYKDELISRVKAVIKELDIPIPNIQFVP